MLDKKRAVKAETIVGEAKRAQQVQRARQKVLYSKNKSKAVATEAIKRVEEYKRAKNPDYKPPYHGRKRKS